MDTAGQIQPRGPRGEGAGRGSSSTEAPTITSIPIPLFLPGQKMHHHFLVQSDRKGGRASCVGQDVPHVHSSTLGHPCV